MGKRYIDADRFERVLLSMGEDNICNECCMNVIEKLDAQPTSTDWIGRDVFNQVKWERDTAIAQLEALGYGLGEEPRAGELQAKIVGIDEALEKARELQESLNNLTIGIGGTEYARVVRCEDCKFSRVEYRDCYHIRWCGSRSVQDDHYCKRGKRREEDE